MYLIWRHVPLGLSLLCLGMIGGCSAAVSKAPLAVAYRSVRPGKPTLRTYVVQFDLLNHEDRPMWYVLRYWAEKPLPATAKIVAGPGDQILLGYGVLSLGERQDGYHWDTASSRCVESFGDRGFIALRLPAHGELHLPDCGLEAWAWTPTIEIWRASAIHLNGAVPLEEWIAARKHAPEGLFATLTDANRDPRSPGSILYGAKPEAVDIVNSVEFRDLRRWTVPIEGMPPNDSR